MTRSIKMICAATFAGYQRPDRRALPRTAVTRAEMAELFKVELGYASRF